MSDTRQFERKSGNYTLRNLRRKNYCGLHDSNDDMDESVDVHLVDTGSVSTTINSISSDTVNSHYVHNETRCTQRRLDTYKCSCRTDRLKKNTDNSAKAIYDLHDVRKCSWADIIRMSRLGCAESPFDNLLHTLICLHDTSFPCDLSLLGYRANLETNTRLVRHTLETSAWRAAIFDQNSNIDAIMRLLQFALMIRELPT